MELRNSIISLINLLEAKDHLIDKLDLTDEQKSELKDFFRRYPNLESKIDWNRKDLTYEDFKSLLANEGKSKSQAKKKGLEGITEGIDYRVLDQKEDFIAYQPLTYRGSVTIASNRVPPVKENGAKWCTAYQKTSEYWDNYTEKGGKFCYVCTKDTKYALVVYPDSKQECYSFEDDKIYCPENLKYLYNILLDQMKKEKEDFEPKYLPSLYEEWKKTGEVNIPEKYRKYVTSITIPNSVISIGNNAFKDCENLKSITIPNSVIFIGNRAFQYCESLESIIIPGPVTSIRYEVFEGCRSLKSIIIPNSVTSLDYGAFHNCRSLENIIIPESVTNIGNFVFSGCKNLESIVIPDSVTSIGYGAFTLCGKLTIYYQGTKEQWGKIERSDNIERPVIFKKRDITTKTLEHLNNYLLRFEENKDHLIDRLNLTDDQKNQLKAFFKKYPNYESKIDWNKKNLTFKDFKSLLANEGKSKSQAKKRGVSGLVEGTDYRILFQQGPVTIYYPLTHLGSKVLASEKTGPKVEAKWCISMNDNQYWNHYTARKPYYDFFFIFVDNPEWQEIFRKVAICRSLKIFNNRDDNTEELFTADDKTLYKGTFLRWLEEQYPEAYKALKDVLQNYPSVFAKEEEFKKTGFHISNGILETIDRERWQYRNSEPLVLPEGTLTVAPWVCAGLWINKLVFPKSLEMLSSESFAVTEGLTKVEFPEGSHLIEVGSRAFRDCHNLRTVILPEGLQIIWHDAFLDCKNLTTVKLPDSVITLDSFAFQGCSSLREITLPKSLNFLGKRVFEDCPNLKVIRYPDTLLKFCERTGTIGYSSSSDKILNLINPAAWIQLQETGKLDNKVIDGLTDYLLNKGTYRHDQDHRTLVNTGTVLQCTDQTVQLTCWPYILRPTKLAL